MKSGSNRGAKEKKKKMKKIYYCWLWSEIFLEHVLWAKEKIRYRKEISVWIRNLG